MTVFELRPGQRVRRHGWVGQKKASVRIFAVKGPSLGDTGRVVLHND